MNTTSHAKLLDRKEKARKSSLQWLFSDKANENCGYRISDKRNVGVELNNNKKIMTGPSGSHSNNNNNDGLLGSLIFDSFFGGALTSLFHGVNIMSIASAVDEIWVDRRSSAPAPHPEATYFPC